MPKLNFRAKATILLKSVASQACRQGEGGGGGGLPASDIAKVLS